MENERCTRKISELKARLGENQREGSASEMGSYSDKIYAKSFKVTSDASRASGYSNRKSSSSKGGNGNYF